MLAFVICWLTPKHSCAQILAYNCDHIYFQLGVVTGWKSNFQIICLVSHVVELRLHNLIQEIGYKSDLFRCLPVHYQLPIWFPVQKRYHRQKKSWACKYRQSTIIVVNSVLRMPQVRINVYVYIHQQLHRQWTAAHIYKPGWVLCTQKADVQFV